MTDLHNWLIEAWIDPFWRGFIIAVLCCLALEIIGNLFLFLVWKPLRARHARNRAQKALYAGFEDELPVGAPEPEEGADEDSAASDWDPRSWSMPFGPPKVMVYNVASYEEPLRCSTSFVCHGRPLREHELFWAIPRANDPDGPFLVVCSECTVIPDPSLSDEILGMENHR